MQLNVAVSLGLISLLTYLAITDAKDVKVFKRGSEFSESCGFINESCLEHMLIDETQFKNPNDYSFDDDQDDTDLENAYDEKVPYLPKFILHKNGFDRGYTRVSYFGY